MSREHDLDRLYSILDDLRRRQGGFRYLRDCSALSGWPKRGVYYFFEDGERRQGADALRVVRVGTHALKAGSRATLWGRLSQHRGSLTGTFAGGGNHRGSVFRLHVGTALLNSGDYHEVVWDTWGKGSTAPRPVRHHEYPLEKDVSERIGAMPFLWVDVPGEPGRASDRGLIESCCIGLLSNLGRPPLDPSSADWLGRSADRDKVRESGLWNVNHVDNGYDPSSLDLLESLGPSR